MAEASQTWEIVEISCGSSHSIAIGGKCVCVCERERERYPNEAVNAEGFSICDTEKTGF